MDDDEALESLIERVRTEYVSGCAYWFFIGIGVAEKTWWWVVVAFVAWGIAKVLTPSVLAIARNVRRRGNL